MLAGVEGREACRAELARGLLPPELLGKPVIDRVYPVVEGIVSCAGELAGDLAAAGSVDVRVDLGSGRALRGTVPGVAGDVLQTVLYARVSARHRIAAWTRLLALTAARPDRSQRAVIVGRGERDAIRIVRLGPVDAADAHERLRDLVALYDEGMRAPLPISCRTSAAYAAATLRGGDGALAALREWESTYEHRHEDADPEHRLVHGRVISFAELTADGRFARYALRLWEHALAAEQAEDR
jgi:exodeoxyribonuclease V gamma subunit